MDSDKAILLKVSQSRLLKDYWGAYLEHKDSTGRVIAFSHKYIDFLGNEYIEHRDAFGKVLGHTYAYRDFFGNNYLEHKDSHGNIIGKSSTYKDFFDEYFIQHTDTSGNDIGKTRYQKDLLGDNYASHTFSGKTNTAPSFSTDTYDPLGNENLVGVIAFIIIAVAIVFLFRKLGNLILSNESSAINIFVFITPIVSTIITAAYMLANGNFKLKIAISEFISTAVSCFLFMLDAIPEYFTQLLTEQFDGFIRVLLLVVMMIVVFIVRLLPLILCYITILTANCSHTDGLSKAATIPLCIFAFIYQLATLIAQEDSVVSGFLIGLFFCVVAVLPSVTVINKIRKALIRP